MKTLPTVAWIAIVLGCLFAGSHQIKIAWSHTGDGTVGEGDVVVDERAYKRDHYAMGGMILLIGLVVLTYGIIDLSPSDDPQSSPPPP